MGLFTRTKRSSTSSSAASTAPNSGITTPTAVDNLSHSPTHTSSGTSPPNFAPISKTPSRLTLTKTLTWGKRSKEDKYRRRIESWEREDQNEWDAPTARPHGRRKLCSKKEQEVLRAFEWKVCTEGRESIDGGRSRSCFSGVSPGWESFGEGECCFDTRCRWDWDGALAFICSIGTRMWHICLPLYIWESGQENMDHNILAELGWVGMSDR
ncbi:hypothetical protein BKA64DRAFT_306563 [Cadophora sp. MPI-SDFR-AT-0126]|nr:hypothetical protein BKA64DRAFT_306563 [Leotiomycetes sp. MPI-SDFR-AT-0126]